MVDPFFVYVNFICTFRRINHRNEFINRFASIKAAIERTRYFYLYKCNECNFYRNSVNAIRSHNHVKDR